MTHIGEEVIAKLRRQPPVLPAEAGIQGWGGGANPDTNSFPRRHHPRYASPMHSRTDKKGARPQGDAPSQSQVVFLSTPPTPDTGCFFPVQKTRNKTNPTSEKAWTRCAPVSTFF